MYRLKKQNCEGGSADWDLKFLSSATELSNPLPLDISIALSGCKLTSEDFHMRRKE